MRERFSTPQEPDLNTRPGRDARDEVYATQHVNDDELRRFMGDDIEPIDLNQSRHEIKPTTWH